MNSTMEEITPQSNRVLIIQLEEKMNTLATKQDIQEMKKAFEDFTNAMKFVKTSGKVTYRILLVLATIVVSIVAIGGGFKTMIQWFTGTSQ